MAVNPKIIMMVAQTAKNPKVRRAILNFVLISLGLIMMIFVIFTGLISGLLAIIENNDLKNHWNYYRTSISELFNGIEGEVNTPALAAARFIFRNFWQCTISVRRRSFF